MKVLLSKMDVRFHLTFDNVEEIQAESQKVLKTLKQKDFQDSFRSWQKR
jgi:hypothetical protein